MSDIYVYLLAKKVQSINCRILFIQQLNIKINTLVGYAAMHIHSILQICRSVYFMELLMLKYTYVCITTITKFLPHPRTRYSHFF